MNRDYPLAPTYFPDNKRKLARQEDRQIRKQERKIQKSTGLEYEPPVRKRDMKPLKK